MVSEMCKSSICAFNYRTRQLSRVYIMRESREIIFFLALQTVADFIFISVAIGIGKKNKCGSYSKGFVRSSWNKTSTSEMAAGRALNSTNSTMPRQLSNFLSNYALIKTDPFWLIFELNFQIIIIRKKNKFKLVIFCIKILRLGILH